MKRLLSILPFLLLWCAPAKGVTPAIVRHRGCPSGAATLYTTYQCALPRPTLASNGIVCMGQYGVNAAVSLTLSDDKGDTFTAPVVNSDANQTIWASWVLTATTGTKNMTITYSGANAGFSQWWCGEMMNVTAADVHAGNTGTSTTPNATIVTTATNDLVIMLAEADTSASCLGVTGTWTAGTGYGIQQGDPGYAASNVVCEGVEAGVIAASGSTNPSITMSSSLGWNALAISFKSGTQGTANPAFDILTMEHYNVVAAASGFKLAEPSTGNLGVLGCINAPANGTISAVSGSVSGTWTQAGHVASVGGSGILMWWYKQNTTLALNDILTITTTGGSFVSGDCVIYGIQGAATSAYDSTLAAGSGTSCSTGFCTVSGTSSATGNFAAGIVTPTNASEFLLAETGVNSPQLTGSSGQFLSDIASSPQEASANELDENNGKFSNLTSSATAQTLTVVQGSGQQVGGWQSAIVGFSASSGGGGGSNGCQAYVSMQGMGCR
jgi:hypothetical protein